MPKGGGEEGPILLPFAGAGPDEAVDEAPAGEIQARSRLAWESREFQALLLNSFSQIAKADASFFVSRWFQALGVSAKVSCTQIGWAGTPRCVRQGAGENHEHYHSNCFILGGI